MRLTFYSLLIAMAITSCDQTTERDQQSDVAIQQHTNLITIHAPRDGIEVIKESTLPYHVSIKDTSILKKHYISLDNESINELQGILDISKLGLGEHSLRVKAVLGDGRVEVKSISFLKLSDVSPTEQSYKIMATYPHNPNDYTQGLEIDNGIVYEGTGMRGESMLKVWELKTSTVVGQKELEDNFFGEGITVMGDKIYQLSWQSQTGFVYNKKTLNRIKSFSYPNEGWGLTNDGNHLIMSDGTNKLTYLDPTTFEKVKEIQVFDDLTGVYDLNELEYKDGDIYANVYRTNMVVVIESATGKVKSRIDFSGLLDTVEVEEEVDVLNGIAFDNTNDKLYVTGKWWPAIFEVQLFIKKDI